MRVPRMLAAAAAVLAVVLLAGTAQHASAQTADQANATLSSPTDGSTYYIEYDQWCTYSTVAYPIVTVTGDMSVDAVGPANTNFDVDWNTWIKVDGVSVVPNATSHGTSTQMFGPDGKWSMSAHLTGNQGFTTTGSHTAEAAAIITVGTTTKSAFDRHGFTIDQKTVDMCPGGGDP